MSLVAVENLSRHFGDRRAIDAINLTVARWRSTWFSLGPNGAGKSTTMQIICGALAPSAGQVRIDGIDLFARPREAKRRLGYLPEVPPIYPELSVDEYLDFCGRLHEVPRATLRTARERTKARCGLADSGRSLLANLSKGYRQRVGLAQAIIHNPKVIVLDEPTEGLDPNQMREIRTLIRELGTDHSVILSTHLLPEVQAVCERVIILHEGRLVFDHRLDTSSDDAANQAVVVGLANPPALATLTALPGITAVEALPERRFLLHYDSALTAPTALASTAVNAGWKLMELTPQRESLEEILTRLTIGEARVAAPKP